MNKIENLVNIGIITSIKMSNIQVDDILKYCLDNNIKKVTILSYDNIFNYYKYKKLQDNGITVIPTVNVMVKENDKLYGRVNIYPRKYEDLKYLNIGLSKKYVNLRDLKEIKEANLKIMVPTTSDSLIDNIKEFLQDNSINEENKLSNYITGFELQEHGFFKEKLYNSRVDKLILRYPQLITIKTGGVILKNKSDLRVYKKQSQNPGANDMYTTPITYNKNYSIEELPNIHSKYTEEDIKDINNFMKDLDYQIKSAKDYGYLLPKYDENLSYEETTALLKKLAYDGYKEKVKKGIILFDKYTEKEYEDRLEQEFDIVIPMGFIDYFLIFKEVQEYVEKQGFVTGPGRGSAAGSLILFCMGLTRLDPIAQGLLFERFLNPDRVSMPDIDMDFEPEGKKIAEDYMRSRFGIDKAMNVATINVVQMRGAFEAAALDYKDQVSKLKENIGDDENANLEKFKNSIVYEEMKNKITTERVAQRQDVFNLVTASAPIVHDAEILFGSTKTYGQHASAFIVSSKPIDEVAPLYFNGEVTQLGVNGYDAEEMGLLKFDFLSINALTLIRSILEKYGNDETYDDLVWKSQPNKLDTKALGPILNKELTSIWQIEGDNMGIPLNSLVSGMYKLNPNITGQNLFDAVSSISAMGRPGPMEFIPEYLASMNDPMKKYLNSLPEVMRPPLMLTNGILVYQEQIMNLGGEFGFTMGEKDLLRKAVGKKLESVLKKLEPKFKNLAVEKGVPKDFIENYWTQTIMPFAEYAFNKSHSDCYALIAMMGLDLKVRFKEGFYAEAFNLNKDAKKQTNIIEEMLRVGIELHSPKLHKCYYETYGDVGTNNVYFGVSQIKSIGTEVAKKIEKCSQDLIKEKPNATFEDFLIYQKTRYNFSKTVIENLIKIGFFD